MDIVFTYVDGSNPSWAAAHSAATGKPVNDIRCLDHGELVLAARLLKRHCAWLQTVHIVYAGDGVAEATLAELEQLFGPQQLHLVSQDELLPWPTFSSCVVEAHLHLIPGLSDVFLYCNDDMFIGRPLHLRDLLHADGRPWIDMSEVAHGAATNLAQEHSDNAYRLFRGVFPRHATPRVHVSHFASIMVTQACREAWSLFGDALLRSMQSLVRTRASINFQLLAGLVAVASGLAHRRTRMHRQGMAWAMLEMEQEGLQFVLAQMPHHFCINGVNAENQTRFQAFARAYVSRCGTYPPITRWSWSSEAFHAHDRQWLCKGDDRRTAGDAPPGRTSSPRR